MAAKPKQAQQETDVCGACHFCRAPDKDTLMCWVMPPMPLGEAGNYGFARGAEVEALDPKCFFYTPRLSA